MSNFNEADVNRQHDGKFGAKQRPEALGPDGVDILASVNGPTDAAAVEAAVTAAVAEANRTGKPVLIDPSVLSGSGYWPDEQGTGEGMGGDVSIGAEPSYRLTWATGDDAEPFISVTETCFVIARRDGDDRDLDYDDWDDAVRAAKRERDRIGGDPDSLPKIRYAVESITEWIGHTDPDGPGNSEVVSEYARGEGSSIFYHSLHEAETAARNRARSTDPNHYDLTNWKANR